MQCYKIRHKAIYDRFLTENNVLLLWQKIMKLNLIKDNGAFLVSMGLHGRTGH